MIKQAANSLNPALAPEPVLPVERLLFYGEIVKIGRFDCPSDHHCFARTAPLNNNLFVVTHQPLWWRRDEGDYRFAEPGAALLHRSGGQVERKSVRSGGDIADWFGIRQDIFEEILERHQLHRQNVTERTVALVTDPRFRLRETQLITSLQKSQHSNLAIEEGALALFDAVCHGLSKNHGPQTATKTNIRRQRLVDKTRNLLNSLEDDSQGAERNPTLSRDRESRRHLGVPLMPRIRDESGMTLHAYRQAQKLGRALKLMQSSQQDLTELAHELGFSSHSHFTRVFRQHLGEAPSRIQFA